MRESERWQNSFSGPTADSSEACAHGHEPGQADLGEHPATNYIATHDTRATEGDWRITDRTASAQDLRSEWITVDDDHCIGLGENR